MEPTVDDRDELLKSDYVDSFSTMLAIKVPGLEPKYDGHIVAIQDALAAFAHDQPLDELPGRAKKPYVLLRNLEGSEMIRRPMADFGDASAGQEIQVGHRFMSRDRTDRSRPGPPVR